MIRDKKKVIIFTSIILGVLVVTLGITYSLFTFNQTGGTSKLILGDIYMHYKETNQLSLSDAMPIDINDYITYKVNSIMQEQELVENELIRCVNYLDSRGIPVDTENFCRGTEEFYGYTFQELLDNNQFGIDMIEEMLSLNVIIQNDDSTYTVNPVMREQSVEEMNELTTCINYVTNLGISISEGEDFETFCKGTGTTNDGMTFQDIVDEIYGVQSVLSDNSTINAKFLAVPSYSKIELAYLKENNIILPQIINLPYFEFTISGKNTYTKEDIWYEIVLSHGSDHDTRTTRIRDDLLKFTLIEVVNGNNNILVDNKSYSDLTNKRIYVDTIDADTKTEISRTYRLYMWISDETVLGNVNEDYTLEEWNDVFASIKVNVSGDFKEKIVYTDASCFGYENEYIVNPIMREQSLGEGNELDACVSIYTDWEAEFDEGSTAETFCKGTGTGYGITIQEDLDNWSIGNENFLEEGGQALLDDGVIFQGVEINDYDARCGSDVVIPKTINGYDVTTIGGESFSNSKITSVRLPNGVVRIGSQAFYNNLLSSVIIPDSVEFIGEESFANNPLYNIEIGSNVSHIADRVFNNYSYAGYGGIYTKNVTIKGKTSLDDFDYYGEYVFSWAEGLSDNDIIFKP